MNNKYFEIYSKRMNRMTTILFMILIIILTGYGKIQLLNQPELKNIVEKHAYKNKIIIGNRGKILDTNNKELATTINKYTFWVNTEKQYDEQKIIDLFSEKFNKNPDFYIDKLKKESRYVVLEKNISDSKASEILNKIKKIKGLRYDKNLSRLYSYNNLASQTLGYINTKGIGTLGIEKSCNHLLKGDTLNIVLKKGANGKFFSSDLLDENTINGSDVQLTIDIELQRILQKELLIAMNNAAAKGANGIIMNPHNGEILAIASVPDFNPNSYGKFEISSYNNAVISDSYEPGSTFKILPYAFALQMGKYNEQDSIFCENGSYRLANNRTLNDHEEHGYLTLEEILIHSSNIGISKISDSFNKKSIFKFLKKFGIGSKTYIPLNNEASGKMRYISDWSKTSKNYISIGQEISLTNLQLAIIYSSIANGGYIVQPKIIKQVIKNGEINYINKTKTIRRAINNKTAQDILNTLKLVVDEGTAQTINLKGYNIAGKTGTAQKFENGEYSKYIATFASIFPANNPEYVMIVSIDEPIHGKHWSNLSAVPASREIIKKMIITNKEFHKNTSNEFYVDNQTDSINVYDKYKALKTGKMPDLRGKSLRESFKIAEIVGLKLSPKGTSGKVSKQSIPPGEKIQPNMTCKITMKI